MYDAIDTDNESTLQVDQVREFMINFLRGNTNPEYVSETSMNEIHENGMIKQLEDFETGELTLEDLSKFLTEFLKA